jgi:hypothetical protein
MGFRVVLKESRWKKCGHSGCSPDAAVHIVRAALYRYDNAVGEAAYAPAGAVNFTLRDAELVGAGRRHDISAAIADTHHGGSEGTLHLNCFLRIHRENPGIIHSLNGNNEAGVIVIRIIEK